MRRQSSITGKSTKYNVRSVGVADILEHYSRQIEFRKFIERAGLAERIGQSDLEHFKVVY